MNKYKIIHVLKGKANPETMNGVNKVVHHLARTQLEQGHDVQVWGITSTPRKISHQHAYPLHLFAPAWSRFAVSTQMHKALDSVPTGTIFHLHSVFLPELYALSRHLVRRGFCYVIAPHGGYAPEGLKKNFFFKKIYHALFESRLVAGASAIHALGQHGEADQFDFHSQSQRVGVVPNGYTPGEEYKTQWQPDPHLQLCFCGRLAMAHKGLDLLLEGMAHAVGSGVNVRLDLIGDGPDRDALEGMAARLQLGGRVKFHGALFGANKEIQILKADVFVHTSRWDGIPMAVLEAAALGLPVMVSEATNMAGYVRESAAGYALLSLDVRGISKCIEQAAFDRENGANLPDKGMNARKMILDSFSWGGVASALSNNVYSKVFDD